MVLITLQYFLSVSVNDKDVPWWTSCRLCMAIIGFFGFVHIYAQRVGMSVAIVCMVNHTAVAMLKQTDTNGTADVLDANATTGPPARQMEVNITYYTIYL